MHTNKPIVWIGGSFAPFAMFYSRLVPFLLASPDILWFYWLVCGCVWLFCWFLDVGGSASNLVGDVCHKKQCRKN